MSEQDTSSTLITLDDLLRCASLSVDKHLCTAAGAKVAISRVNSLTIVGDEQVTQWIDDLQQGKFNQPQANILLQRAAMNKGTSFTTPQARAAFGALRAMYLDLVDMRTGDTDAISNRHKGHARKKQSAPEKPLKPLDQKPSASAIPHPAYGMVVPGTQVSLATLAAVTVDITRDLQEYIRPIVQLVNSDARTSLDDKALIINTLTHLGNDFDNLRTWQQIRPR